MTRKNRAKQQKKAQPISQTAENDRKLRQ